ncbi:cytochrome c oxidase subunit III [gamma proteobacterium BDW918]|jgi:cytochrome c oxidase subunit 3|uniref:cytochrome-c oxidase n=1 Tax=Zhongshania aliphaticivorans TaxID=1470434 RepID=A0A127M0Q3_9GAMM|nr:cytochrome c oxidase subunit 3 [Zhongshania aliphaticivorans]AMO66797.1 MFS transporter [Zhongshania aliphaticivorans]EIF41462.1 cytochrome c oxidase subunit III [gamma proteobacterium BDW918]|tara:strand:+ start:20899 stop:21882 length:984 start_codon:yes stop_codon:yes gene_type:complete
MAGQSKTGYETYYVPDSSKLAVSATIGMTTTVYGAASFINDNSYRPGEETNSGFILVAGLVWLAATLFQWFSITIKENRAGMNSAQLKHSYVLGMQWFIFSEVMFFAAFFGALFYIRNLSGPWLAGQGEAGAMNGLLWPGFEYNWPLLTTPQDAIGGVQAQAAAGHLANNGEFTGAEKHLSFPGFANIAHWLPLYNTIILLASSFTCHIAHVAMKQNNRKKFNLWLFITVAMGITFLYLQYMEYHEALFEYGIHLNSGVYGTTFFMLTGFHGFHVAMGTFMLLVQWLRSAGKGHFSANDQFGFEASSWYWHFVDVVWVFLFLFVYII